jgi:hypothetical protein
MVDDGGEKSDFYLFIWLSYRLFGKPFIEMLKSAIIKMSVFS